MVTAPIEAAELGLRPRAAEAARAWAGALGRGLAIGVALGVGFRAWMRLVSTQPEFTWSGTLFIIMAATIAAVGASLSRTARARWRRRWARAVARVLGTVSMLLLGSGAGMIALPVWVFGGLAWGRTSWKPSVRGGLWVTSALATAGVLRELWSDFSLFGVPRSVLAVCGFLAIMAVIAKLFTWPTGTPTAVVDTEA